MSSFTRSFVRGYPLDFRRLWWSSIATNLGDGALLAAGPLLVATVSPSPAAVGTAVFVQQLPGCSGVAQWWGLTAGFWIAGVSMLLIGLLAWRPVSALAAEGSER